MILEPEGTVAEDAPYVAAPPAQMVRVDPLGEVIFKQDGWLYAALDGFVTTEMVTLVEDV